MSKPLYLATLLAVAVSGCSTAPAASRPPRVASTGGVSPHETTSAVVGGNRVTLTYGRPFSKDPKNGEIRKIWGGLIPWGKAWRMGADEATLLLTQFPLVIGGTTISAGAYSLYAVPVESGVSKLVFSKTVGQYGDPVDEMNDFARVDMEKKPLDKRIDQFTMSIEKNPPTGGTIILQWEYLQFSVPFTVKK